jgi:Lon protease-like protein
VSAAEAQGVLSDDDAAELRDRWERLQARFVDSPQDVVEEADQLVQDVFDHVTRTFADERRSLEEQWQRGEEASTEDLRVALQRYRSFFQRLLAV